MGHRPRGGLDGKSGTGRVFENQVRLSPFRVVLKRPCGRGGQHMEKNLLPRSGQ